MSTTITPPWGTITSSGGGLVDSKSWPLTSVTHRVGRELNSDTILTSALVSKRHATIETDLTTIPSTISPGMCRMRVWVTDTSTNGTFTIDGKALPKDIRVELNEYSNILFLAKPHEKKSTKSSSEASPPRIEIVLHDLTRADADALKHRPNVLQPSPPSPSHPSPQQQPPTIIKRARHQPEPPVPWGDGSNTQLINEELAQLRLRIQTLEKQNAEQRTLAVTAMTAQKAAEEKLNKMEIRNREDEMTREGVRDDAFRKYKEETEAVMELDRQSHASELRQVNVRTRAMEDDFRQQISRLVEHEQELMRQMAIMTNEKKDIQNRLADHEATLRAADSTRQELETSISRLTSQLKESEKRAEAINEEKKAVASTLVKTQTEISEWQFQISALKQTINNKDAELTKLTQEMDIDGARTRDALGTALSQIDQLKQTITNVRAKRLSMVSFSKASPAVIVASSPPIHVPGDLLTQLPQASNDVLDLTQPPPSSHHAITLAEELETDDENDDDILTKQPSSPVAARSSRDDGHSAHQHSTGTSTTTYPPTLTCSNLEAFMPPRLPPPPPPKRGSSPPPTQDVSMT